MCPCKWDEDAADGSWGWQGLLSVDAALDIGVKSLFLSEVFGVTMSIFFSPGFSA